MVEAEPEGINIRLRAKYRRITLLLLVVAILFTIWTLAVIFAVFSLQLAGRWTLISPTYWVLADITIVALFLVVDALIFSRYRAKTHPSRPKAARVKKARKAKAQKEPASQMMKGRAVYTVTLPIGAKGGIFSKTFVAIDDSRVLQLRYQMIPPTSLWPPQQ